MQPLTVFLIAVFFCSFGQLAGGWVGWGLGLITAILIVTYEWAMEVAEQ